MNENGWPSYWGHLFTPLSHDNHVVETNRVWAIDNGMFTKGLHWSALLDFLIKMDDHRLTCQFVVIPDVMANAIATLDRFRWLAWKIKAMGWPVAFVAQDGQETYDLPPEYDALFVGGSTAWKMSDQAVTVIKRAKADDKWVHVGRVNSQKRIAYFQMYGVDSVDGTCLTYGPDLNRRRLGRQLAQRPLPDFD